MKRLTKNLALAALATATLVGTASADRRTGLGGNFLIEDQTDLYSFPQLVLDYKNTVNVTFGDSQGEGSAFLTFGKRGGGKTAFGVLVNRGDVGQGLGGGVTGLDHERGMIFGNPGIPYNGNKYSNAGHEPATMVDLVFGMKLGGKNKLGFRLGIGNGGFNDGNGTEYGETTLRLTGGFGFGGSKLNGNLALDLGVGTGTAIPVKGAKEQSVFGFSANVLGRVYMRMNKDLDLGILGNLGFSTLGGDNKDDQDSFTTFGILAGAGPVYTIGDKKTGSTIAGYAMLGYNMRSQDPSEKGNNDKVSMSTVTLPGVRLAFEHPIVEWLYFRAGAEYTWMINGASPESGDGPSARGDHANAMLDGGASFGWNAGLGLKVGDFRFDGALSHGWLNEGPALLGDNSKLFVLSSASYSW